MSDLHSEESREAIAARLRELRLALGYNQTEFARRIGVSLNSWNNWEKSVSRPKITEACQMARVLGVTLDWIYRAEEASLPKVIIKAFKKARSETSNT